MALELQQQADLAVGFMPRRAEREQIAGLDPEFAAGDLFELVFDDRTGEVTAARGELAERAELAERDRAEAQLVGDLNIGLGGITELDRLAVRLFGGEIEPGVERADALFEQQLGGDHVGSAADRF